MLGFKMKRAAQLKEQVNKLLETKRAAQESRDRAEQAFIESALYGDDLFDEEDFADLTVFNSRQEALEDFDTTSYSTIANSIQLESDVDEDSFLYEQVEEDDSSGDIFSPSSSSPFDGILDGGSSILSSSEESALTDQEISSLGVAGGRDELYKILLEGALARDKMIRSNIRLVVSIAKKWARFTSGGGDNSQGSSDSKSKGRSTLYGGSASRPSLDEAIQEGIIGLARAADGFEPERGLKFGTYATWWITNSVRAAYYGAITGTVRVPINYHNVRQQYRKRVNEYLREHDEEPAFDDIARDMDLKPERLRFILESTQTLVSIDEPLGPNNWVGGGRAAPGDGTVPDLKDSIEWYVLL